MVLPRLLFSRGTPAISLPATAKLAQLINGRCLSVHYHLAPSLKSLFPTLCGHILVAKACSALIAAPSLGRKNILQPQFIPSSCLIFTGESIGNISCIFPSPLLLMLYCFVGGRDTLLQVSYGMAKTPPCALAAISAWADLARSLRS